MRAFIDVFVHDGDKDEEEKNGCMHAGYHPLFRRI